MSARSALVAGATGLVGRELMALLAADGRWSDVHALVRKPLAAGAWPESAKATLHEHVVDFAHLARTRLAGQVDDAFVCLGTTIRTAGTREAFRAVDFDYVVATARLAQRRGARRLAVVSAMGADAGSRVFYNRVKGEVEAALIGLALDSLTLVRPSLLAGERSERRPAEQLALRVAAPIGALLPRRYRPVPAAAVARCMIDAVFRGAPGVRVVESDRIQDFAR